MLHDFDADASFGQHISDYRRVIDFAREDYGGVQIEAAWADFRSDPAEMISLVASSRSRVIVAVYDQMADNGSARFTIGVPMKSELVGDKPIIAVPTGGCVLYDISPAIYQGLIGLGKS